MTESSKNTENNTNVQKAYAFKDNKICSCTIKWQRTREPRQTFTTALSFNPSAIFGVQMTQPYINVLTRHDKCGRRWTRLPVCRGHQWNSKIIEIKFSSPFCGVQMTPSQRQHTQDRYRVTGVIPNIIILNIGRILMLNVCVLKSINLQSKVLMKVILFKVKAPLFYDVWIKNCTKYLVNDI